MAYTTDQIKDKFLTYIDEYYTGYWDTTPLTDIAQKAVSNIIEQKLKADGYADKVNDELLPLKNKVTNTSYLIDLDAIKYKKLAYISVDYGHGPRLVTPSIDVEMNTAYSNGTQRYPKYYSYNVAGTRTMELSPSTGLVSYEMFYYKDPLVSDQTNIDFTVASYTIKYTDKLVELIIDEMVKLAGQIIREQELQVSAANNEVMNP